MSRTAPIRTVRSFVPVPTGEVSDDEVEDVFAPLPEGQELDRWMSRPLPKL